MFAICEPAVFSLEANETKQITITLTVPRDMPSGGHEKTQLRFTANGETDTAFVLTLYTMSALSHPYIYHDQEGWRSAARRGQTLPQVKQSYDTYLKDANAWEITLPEEGKPYCYATQQEHFFMSCAYAYAMTGEKRYAEKIASFFRLFAPVYLIRQRGCSQSYVQEGHFFQHLAISYDIIHDAGVLTEKEHKQIEACFRFYMEVLDQHLKNGHTSNWLLSEITGALYCAFALQDPERIHRFAFGNGGTQQQLIRGTFNDGKQFDSSYDRGEPLEFVCGTGMMIPGFDKAVADMEVGQIVDVHLMPEEAYGPSDPEAIITIEIAQLPGSENLEEGQRVYLRNMMGQPFPVTVTAKDDVHITLDANHEMAGKELNFRIELLEVTD